MPDTTRDLIPKEEGFGLLSDIGAKIQAIASIYGEFYKKDLRVSGWRKQEPDGTFYIDRQTGGETGIFEPSNIWDLVEIFMKENIQPGDKILDLGSGDGRVLAVASLFGAEVTGYEFDEKLYGLANEVLDKIARTSIENAPLIDRSKIKLFRGDFFKADFNQFKFIFYYDQSNKNREAVVEKVLTQPNQNIRFLVYRIQNFGSPVWKSFRYRNWKTYPLTPLEPPYDTRNNSLTVFSGLKALPAASGVSAAVTQLVRKSDTLVPTLIDVKDYKGFPLGQKDELLQAILNKEIIVYFYNDREFELFNFDPQLGKLDSKLRKNVISFGGNETAAYEKFGKIYKGKMIHLSKSADVRKTLGPNGIPLFREQGDLEGTILALKVYYLADGELRA